MANRTTRSTFLSRTGRYLLGALIIAVGLFLAVGGGYLIALGGSWYFGLVGIALTASGLFIVKGDVRGPLIFGAAFVFSIPWALWDAGLEFWPLVSRLYGFAIGAVLVALIYPGLRRNQRLEHMAAYAFAAFVALAVVWATIEAFSPKSVVQPQGLSAPRLLGRPTDGQANWADWGNTPQGTRFATLTQINRLNLDKLHVAWTFRTGIAATNNGPGAENTPVQVGNAVYVCTVYNQVFSLDADTGAKRWEFDPRTTVSNWRRCRGLGYFDARTIRPQLRACARRLFLPTADARLIAIDADTGKPCIDFGKRGTVDLKADMGVVEPSYYQQTSAPLVAGNLVVVGGRVADDFSTNEPPGVVRAYDVLTGVLVWAWDPGNPAITRRPPAGRSYTRGTPNVWSAMSYDASLGLIYLPTGNATPDFWAGERTALDDKYSSSVVAVEIKTGRPRWAFQIVHHDLWDYDIPAQPVLYDIPDAKGGFEPALLEVTKEGEIFVLNRENGRPLTPVQERPAPRGDVAGERYAPTQPYSVGMPSIGNAALKESDMWGATPLDQLICRIEFRQMRYQGVFTPPGLDWSLQYPGPMGGMNWGSVSVDPRSGYMFVNDTRFGLANYLIPRARVQATSGDGETGVVPQLGTPFGAMRQRWSSPLGIPCQKPPYGTLSAINLVTRKLVWQIPVGSLKESGPLGIPMGLTIPIGMPTLGGSLATQSGLLFFAGTQDYYLRAFDSTTGTELWKSPLPSGSQSGPMTYVSPKSGRQYIVVTTGGGRHSSDRNDYVIAYGL